MNIEKLKSLRDNFIMSCMVIQPVTYAVVNSEDYKDLIKDVKERYGFDISSEDFLYEDVKIIHSKSVERGEVLFVIEQNNQ